MNLSEENNTAVFPLENEHFPGEEMAHRKHFEMKVESSITMHTPTYDTPLPHNQRRRKPPHQNNGRSITGL